ncbi:MAG: LytR C-terminal domain-containing protein [Actinomycetota bacterium]
MGRHSSRSQLPFYRSLAGWLVPWAIIGAIVLGGVWIAVHSVVGQGATGPSLANGTAPRHTHRPRPVESSPVAAEAPSPQASVLAKLITSGVTVQVLNATSSPDAADRMANRLTKLGYRVFAIERAAVLYDHTTVFWATESAKPAAEALAAHFGWVAAPKPKNLSAAVSLHVVVGADEG